MVAPLPAFGQGGESKPADKPAANQPAKDAQKPDEFAEAARALSGPAGNAECVWLGKRVVSRLFNDDMDTAFRHLDLYDRFGCPGTHIQAAFRCVVRQGPPDSKNPDVNEGRVNACWLNSSGPAATTAANPASGGTTSREAR